MAEGHLLILSSFADGIRRPTTDLAVKRNAYIAALADRILIAHAEKGGKIGHCARKDSPTENQCLP